MAFLSYSDLYTSAVTSFERIQKAVAVLVSKKNPDGTGWFADAHLVDSAGVDIPIAPDRSIADNGAFTAGTTPAMPVEFVFDDVSTNLATEDKVAVPRITGDRRPIVAPYESHANLIDGTASATGTGDTSVIAAQAAGVRTYVTSVIISNSSATDTEVVLKDGTTARATYPAPNKSGAVHTLPTPLRGTAATAWQFASLAAVTTMKVTLVGYISKT